MPTFTIDEQEFKNVARKFGGQFAYNSKGFALISWGNAGQHHLRCDLQQWENGRFTRFAGQSNIYEYQMSSFHVKRETYYSRDEQDYDYLYFAYQGGGVWQPVWGYNKTEKLRGTAPRNEGSQNMWGDGTKDARDFLAALSDVTRTDQALAMGPVQGARSNLVGQL